jgi:hypothetical protein
MTVDLNRMLAYAVELRALASKALPADRIRMENTAMIIMQAIEEISVSRNGRKPDTVGSIPEDDLP